MHRDGLIRPGAGSVGRAVGPCCRGGDCRRCGIGRLKGDHLRHIANHYDVLNIHGGKKKARRRGGGEGVRVGRRGEEPEYRIARGVRAYLATVVVGLAAGRVPTQHLWVGWRVRKEAYVRHGVASRILDVDCDALDRDRQV